MSEKFINAGVAILVGIIGVAVIATLVSKSSNTSGVLSASSGGFSKALCTALTPLGISCGGSLTPNVNSTITFPSDQTSVDSTITYPSSGTTFPRGFTGGL